MTALILAAVAVVGIIAYAVVALPFALLVAAVMRHGNRHLDGPQ